MLFSVSSTQLLWFGSAIATLTVLLAGMDIAAESWANPWDQVFGRRAVQHRTAFETRLMHRLSWLGGPYGIVLVAGAFAVAQIVTGHLALAELFLGTLVASTVYVLLVKLLTARKRPTRKSLEVERTFSFPSAHSLASTVTYLGIAVALPGERLVWVCLAAVLIGSIGYSRIYLGCHYLSDVVAGTAGGFAWVGIFLFFR
jgi:membrane-associated phospholipid phosphatase